MKHALFGCLLLIHLCCFSWAQDRYSISGRLIDERQEPVVGAYLMLMEDSLLRKTSVTDIDGKFVLEHIASGTYSIRASLPGLEEYISGPVPVDSNITLPDVRMKSNSGQLEEVTIHAQKPFIEVKADKIVVNVAQSIVSAGSSVMDVLARSPGVYVDNNDQISLKGKPGVMIWIDGRPTPMRGSDLAAVLRSMPSASIEKIELIANPGARYDAAGSAGIINIRTKRSNQFGWNGSFTLTYGQGFYPKYGTGLNLNYRNKKINVYVNYNYAYRYWFNHLMLDRKFLDTAKESKGKQLFRYDQDNYALFNFRNHMASTGLDYKLSAKTTLGFAVSGSTNKFDPQADNKSRALDGHDDLLYRFNTTGRHHNFHYNYAVNGNVRHTFDTAGKELTVDLDYAAFGNDSKQDFVTTYLAPDGSTFMPDYFLKSDLNGLTQIRSLKADYAHPLSSGAQIDVGLKASYTTADNEPLFYEKVNGDYHLDSKRSNHFIYNENINAGYINYAKNWSRFGTQLGLRVENTNAQWEQKTTAQQFDTSYTQLFPSLALQYHLTPRHDLSLTFSRRIERPDYQQLNPFKYFIDKTTYREGYPYLVPASFYSAELSHIFSQRFVTSFVYGINKGVIVEVIQPSDTEDSITVQTNKNLEQMIFIGLNGSYAPQITKWWSNVTSFQVYYARYDGNIANTPLRNGRPTFNINTNNTLMLPAGFSVEVGLNYRARELYGYMDVQPNWMLNAGVQKFLFNRRATLKLNIQDVFFTGYPRATSIYSGYQEDFIAKRETRVGNLSFTYRLGKNTVAPVRKRSGGAQDEINRAGSGNS